MAEKRLYKFQLMLTDSELEEIDNFRFDVRADSRAAAVRSLIQESLENWKKAKAENAEDGQS